MNPWKFVFVCMLNYIAEFKLPTWYIDRWLEWDSKHFAPLRNKPKMATVF